METNHSKRQEQEILDVTRGVEAVVPVKSVVPIGGAPLTQPQILSKLGGFEAAYAAVRDAKATLKQAQLDRIAQLPALRDFMAQLKGGVVALLGPRNPELAKFGWKPKTERAKATGEENLAKAARAKATRLLRGTLGKREKKAVRSVLTPVITVTGTEATPPAEGAGGSASGAGSAGSTGVKTGGTPGSK